MRSVIWCFIIRKTVPCVSLTFDQDANWSPVIMHNGKVMYTRWEYTDLTHYFSRFVMHMNPDGTEQKALLRQRLLFSEQHIRRETDTRPGIRFCRNHLRTPWRCPFRPSDPVRSLQRPQVGTGNGAGTAIPRPQRSNRS